MLHQAQLPLRGLPIHLVLLSNGTVAFVKVGAFSAILETATIDGKPYGYFFDETFILYANGSSEEFQYNTMYAYKNLPTMLAWLKNQALQSPF